MRPVLHPSRGHAFLGDLAQPGGFGALAIGKRAVAWQRVSRALGQARASGALAAEMQNAKGSGVGALRRSNEGNHMMPIRKNATARRLIAVSFAFASGSAAIGQTRL
jgi:hypothetical protein